MSISRLLLSLLLLLLKKHAGSATNERNMGPGMGTSV